MTTTCAEGAAPPTPPRRRIAFVINSIGYGGAERALSNILAGAGPRANKYDLHLILLDRDVEKREMPSIAIRHTLDSRGSLIRSIFLLRHLSRKLRPDLIVSFLVRANVASAVVGWASDTPVLICERMHHSSHLRGKHRGLRSLLARLAPRLAYPLATQALGVSTGVTEDLVRSRHVSASRISTIFNPYDLDAIRRDGADEPEVQLPPRFVVAAGRLEHGKNFVQLLEAYAALDPSFSLVILGEGSRRPELERRIAELDLGKRVLLPGYLRNPFAVMARAEYFVASSLNEGFPNAMGEAMALGRAVVATDCPSGPAEILRGITDAASSEAVDAEYGVLTPNGSVVGLLNGMRRMSDPGVRSSYAELALIRAEQFGLNKIAGQYWDVFEWLIR